MHNPKGIVIACRGILNAHSGALGGAKCDRLRIPKFITEFYLQWFVADAFFMTGEELADAINQPVSSLAHPVQLPCPVYLATVYTG